MKKMIVLILSFISIICLVSCRHSNSGFLPTSKLEEFGVIDIEEQIPFESDYFFKSNGLFVRKDVYMNITKDEQLYDLANSLLNYFHDESKFSYCGYMGFIDLFGSNGDVYASLNVEDYFYNSYRSINDSFYIVFIYVPIETNNIIQLTISKTEETYSGNSYNTKMTFETPYNMTIWDHHKDEYSDYGVIKFEDRNEFDDFYNGFLEYNDCSYFIPFNYEEYFTNFECEFTCHDVYTPIIDEKRFDYEFINPRFLIKMSKNSKVYVDNNAYLLEYTPYNLNEIVIPNEYNIIYEHKGEDKYGLYIGEELVGFLEIKIISEIEREVLLEEFVKSLKIINGE